MEIVRNGMSSINKEFVYDTMYKEYSKEQLEDAKRILLLAITDCTLSTFDVIRLLRKYYSGNLLADIYSIPSVDFLNTRYNCYYQSKFMVEELKKNEMSAYVMTYEANKYSTVTGDKLIKEAHMSVIVPFLDNDERKIIIYDPGLKIDTPIILGGKKEIKLSASGSNDIRICKDDYNLLYPYYISMDGINKFSYNKFSHNIFQRFNPLYYTINPNDIIFPYSFLILSGYKATTFSLDTNKRCSITLSQLIDKLKIYDEEKMETIVLGYDEIIKLGRNGLKDLICNVCNKLSIDVNEMVEDIFFMIEIKDEFIEMMNGEVLREFKCRKREK